MSAGYRKQERPIGTEQYPKFAGKEDGFFDHRISAQETGLLPLWGF